MLFQESLCDRRPTARAQVDSRPAEQATTNQKERSEMKRVFLMLMAGMAVAALAGCAAHHQNCGGLRERCQEISEATRTFVLGLGLCDASAPIVSCASCNGCGGHQCGNPNCPSCGRDGPRSYVTSALLELRAILPPPAWTAPFRACVNLRYWSTPEVTEPTPEAR
jgi:hypothetical protein